MVASKTARLLLSSNVKIKEDFKERTLASYQKFCSIFSRVSIVAFTFYIREYILAFKKCVENFNKMSESLL